MNFPELAVIAVIKTLILILEMVLVYLSTTAAMTELVLLKTMTMLEKHAGICLIITTILKFMRTNLAVTRVIRQVVNGYHVSNPNTSAHKESLNLVSGTVLRTVINAHRSGGITTLTTGTGALSVVNVLKALNPSMENVFLKQLYLLAGMLKTIMVMQIGAQFVTTQLAILTGMMSNKWNFLL